MGINRFCANILNVHLPQQKKLLKKVIAVTDTHQLYEQTLPWAGIDLASLGLQEKRLDLLPREVR